MHPLLLPGTHVVRRGPAELQAGLTRPAAVAFGATTLRLENLPGDERAMRALRRAGLLLEDDHPLRAALPAEGSASPWVRHTVSAVARRTQGSAGPALAARTRHVVTVTAFGHPLSQCLADDLETLCRRTGLRLPQPARPGPARRGVEQPVRLAVLVGVGEPARELVDDLVREAVPHLVVRLVEGRAVVGPFVVPGSTACLRCIDAYLTEDDPAWPLLVEQYARATRSDRSDGIPEPVDAALAALAVGWAARDLAAHTEATRPASWSSTVTLEADLSEVTRRSWPMHPHCGCAWT
jgi:bacteriocin biosynthesis cyclodehydratase domain-containing protein